jgi:hypothetical protein
MNTSFVITWGCEGEGEIADRIQSEASKTCCDYAYWIWSIASEGVRVCFTENYHNLDFDAIFSRISSGGIYICIEKLNSAKQQIVFK